MRPESLLCQRRRKTLLEEVVLISKLDQITHESNQNTEQQQRPIVDVEDKVAKGDSLPMAHRQDLGELALGQNIVDRVSLEWLPNLRTRFCSRSVLYLMIVITSYFICEELTVVARDTKVRTEEITRDISNLARKLNSNRLDDQALLHIGAEVRADDVLVGKSHT